MDELVTVFNLCDHDSKGFICYNDLIRLSHDPNFGNLIEQVITVLNITPLDRLDFGEFCKRVTKVGASPSRCRSSVEARDSMDSGSSASSSYSSCSISGCFEAFGEHSPHAVSKSSKSKNKLTGPRRVKSGLLRHPNMNHRRKLFFDNETRGVASPAQNSVGKTESSTPRLLHHFESQLDSIRSVQTDMKAEIVEILEANNKKLIEDLARKNFLVQSLGDDRLVAERRHFEELLTAEQRENKIKMEKAALEKAIMEKEINTLKEKIKDLSVEMEEKDAFLLNARRENSEIRQELDHIQQKYTNLKEEQTHLRVQNQSLQDKLEKLTDQLEARSFGLEQRKRDLDHDRDLVNQERISSLHDRVLMVPLFQNILGEMKSVSSVLSRLSIEIIDSRRREDMKNQPKPAFSKENGRGDEVVDEEDDEDVMDALAFSAMISENKCLKNQLKQEKELNQAITFDLSKVKDEKEVLETRLGNILNYYSKEFQDLSGEFRSKLKETDLKYFKQFDVSQENLNYSTEKLKSDDSDKVKDEYFSD